MAAGSKSNKAVAGMVVLMMIVSIALAQPSAPPATSPAPQVGTAKAPSPSPSSSVGTMPPTSDGPSPSDDAMTPDAAQPPSSSHAAASSSSATLFAVGFVALAALLF